MKLSNTKTVTAAFRLNREAKRKLHVYNNGNLLPPCPVSSIFRLSDSCFILVPLPSPPTINLPQSLWHIWQELFFLLLLPGYNEYLDTHISRITTQLMSIPRGLRYSYSLHCLQSLVVSILLSLILPFLISRTVRVPSHVNSSMHRSTRFPLRVTCFLASLAVFSIVVAATDTASCQTIVSLKSTESRILHVAPWVIQPRTPLI